ncbi:hypothetical protein [Robiginitalea sp. SC105]|uniref:hypothetical protein n=1 Tax=Robiginitalea sp. SC105 TaxID=2762332 RepID=UPI00163A2BD6|nr:hypothetical protein [Robiginitalea sp. SC105]MBC2838599.1 hypothetical protein [Robiginitalea sp. SC105]
MNARKQPAGMNKLTESRIGGLSMVIGTLLFLITVFLEYRIGWISEEGGPDNVYDFIKSHWPELRNIWTWQMVSGILLLLSYILFLKESKGIKSALWALLMVGNIFSTAAFFLTLGSYGPALEVHEASPEIFESIRGGIASLYRNITIGPLLFMLLFCQETFGKSGLIRKTWGIAALSGFAVLLAVGLAAGISEKISGLSYFILPLVFGFCAIKKGKALPNADTEAEKP